MVKMVKQNAFKLQKCMTLLGLKLETFMLVQHSNQLAEKNFILLDLWMWKKLKRDWVEIRTSIMMSSLTILAFYLLVELEFVYYKREIQKTLKCICPKVKKNRV
jgi:hypothetical protein